MVEQPLAETLFWLLDDLAVAQGGAIPDTGAVGGPYFVHVDQFLVASGIGHVAKLELGVDEDLIQLGQGVADHVEALFEQHFVAINVSRRAEAESLVVALDVGTGDVDVVRFRHAIQAFQYAFGGRGDENFRQLLILLEPFRQGDAAEFALTILVGTPHGACDVLTGDRLDQHGAGFLHDPDERMGNI